MNELQIKNKTIDSREVAEMVEKRHDHLIRDIEIYIKYLENPNLGNIEKLIVTDFFIKGSYNDGVRNYKKYDCTKKGCEFIAHKLTGQKGAVFTAKYINKFHELESATESNIYRLPSSYKEALQQLLIKVEEKEVLETKIEVDKPKVLFAEAVENSDDVILVKEMALILTQHGFKIGQNQLYEYLRKYEYLCKKVGDMRNLPTKKYEHFFKVSKNIIQGTSGTRVTNTPKITGNGQMYFMKRFAEYKEQGLKIEDLLKKEDKHERY